MFFDSRITKEYSKDLNFREILAKQVSLGCSENIIVFTACPWTRGDVKVSATKWLDVDEYDILEDGVIGEIAIDDKVYECDISYKNRTLIIITSLVG